MLLTNNSQTRVCQILRILDLAENEFHYISNIHPSFVNHHYSWSEMQGWCITLIVATRQSTTFAPPSDGFYCVSVIWFSSYHVSVSKCSLESSVYINVSPTRCCPWTYTYSLLNMLPLSNITLIINKVIFWFSNSLYSELMFELCCNLRIKFGFWTTPAFLLCAWVHLTYTKFQCPKREVFVNSRQDYWLSIFWQKQV